MMNDRVVRISEPEGAAAQRPLGVLVIDEKVLVHHADRGDIFLRHKHGSARDDLELRLDFPYVRNQVGGLPIPERRTSAQHGPVSHPAPQLNAAVGHKNDLATDDSLTPPPPAGAPGRRARPARETYPD